MVAGASSMAVDPTPRRDLARLRRIAALRSAHADEIPDLVERLRGYDPPVSLLEIARALGYSNESGVINMMNRAGRPLVRTR